MKGVRGEIGAWGEAFAVRFLERCGYKILDRNARTPYGELDLVAQVGTEQAITVFVEVKTRTTRTYGLPEESVTSRKKQHLLASAIAYLQAHPELDGDWRIDVIAIQRLRPNEEPVLLHFENAVTD